MRLVAALFLLVPSLSFAEAVATASQGPVTVTFYNEPCELPGRITNLAYKLVWTENGKDTKGCWGPRPDHGVLQMWFEDNTVGLVSIKELKRVTGA